MNTTSTIVSEVRRTLPKIWRKPGVTLPPLPSLHDFVNMYRLNAKKILSQNYLMDMNLCRKIVNKAGNLEDRFVVEIGPGPGGITRAILEKPIKRLDVIELDQRFIPPLIMLQGASQERLHIHHGDVLQKEIEPIWRDAEAPVLSWHDDDTIVPFHIIGNLPFNIATPLIIKFLKLMSNREGPWAFGRVPLTLTFQSEVARRIISNIDSDSRSRISIFSQYVSEPKMLFEISGSCFVPSPKIDVGVVRFEPRVVPLIQAHFDVVEKVTNYIFMYRQKPVYKGLRMLYPKDLREQLTDELLKVCKIDPETISVEIAIEEISRLCEHYIEQCNMIPGLYGYKFSNPLLTLETLKENSRTKFPPVYKFFEDQRLSNEGLTLAEFNEKNMF